MSCPSDYLINGCMHGLADGRAADSVMDALMERFSSFDFVLHMGGLAYAQGDQVLPAMQPVSLFLLCSVLMFIIMLYISQCTALCGAAVNVTCDGHPAAFFD